MALPPGTRFGPYDISAKIGAGGMGEVYKARDTRLDRTVAIKILPENLAADPQFRERFGREARTISQLDHPHICTLYDVGEQDGTAFLVMQYLEGETLEQRLKKAALPIDQALQYAIQIADALDKAHRAGIVHRDLKPGNIMLTRSGAKLLDFGLAKSKAGVVGPAGLSMLPTTPPGLTAQGAILGTFQYMAPEQLEGQGTDARTDLFAFGAVLYEMLTGRKAFEGKNQANLIHAIMGVDPPSIGTIQPLTPAVLDHVVKRCLAKAPDERWQSANDLHDALKWIDQERALATGKAVAAPRRHHQMSMAWAAAIVAALVGVAGWVVALRRTVVELPVLRLEITTPPSSDPISFALSPDGRLLVFVANASDGSSKLWLRPLDQTTATALADTEGANYPFWAPDSHSVAFLANGKLKRLDIAGGRSQVIADAPFGISGAWSRDGVILFAPSQTGPLLRVAATGGTTAIATRLRADQPRNSHRLPTFLPDGRHFLFFSRFGPPDVEGVYVGSLDAPDVRRLMASDTAAKYAPPGYLFHVRQGTLMVAPFDASRGVLTGEPVPIAQDVGWAIRGRSAFSVSSTGILAHRMTGMGRRQLVWFDRRGTAVGTAGPPDDFVMASPDLSSNDQRVAIARIVQGTSDIWLIDTTRGGLRSRFTFNPGIDNYPVWAPDGSRVAFLSERGGKRSLFEKSANGGSAERQLLAVDDIRPPDDYSPDGHTLLYEGKNEKDGSGLWALPLDGPQKPFAVVKTAFNADEGQFSPDGRWIAYRSDESGQAEIYVQPFPGPGGKQLVSTSGGSQPRWRRDGRELFYIAADMRLMTVPISGSSQGQALNVGTPTALFPTRLVSMDQPRPQYAVAADGERFLMNVGVADATTSPITVVVNWQAAFRAHNKTLPYGSR